VRQPTSREIQIGLLLYGVGLIAITWANC